MNSEELSHPFRKRDLHWEILDREKRKGLKEEGRKEKLIFRSGKCETIVSQRMHSSVNFCLFIWGFFLILTRLFEAVLFAP